MPALKAGQTCTLENKQKWWGQAIFYFNHLIEPYKGVPYLYKYFTNLKSLDIFFTSPHSNNTIAPNWQQEGF